jgi:hypothetical protein
LIRLCVSPSLDIQAAIDTRIKEAEASEPLRAAVASLQRAEFVPYGSQVLLA